MYDQDIYLWSVCMIRRYTGPCVFMPLDDIKNKAIYFIIFNIMKFNVLSEILFIFIYI